jgi:pimeloyl-ACP methyl ester carboxylesterase
MSLNLKLLFDSNFYLENNPDVAVAVASGETDALQHFQEFGQFEGRDPSLFFNTQFYLANYPEVVTAIDDGKVDSAFNHYLQFGQFKERNPIPQFNEQTYLEQNSDIEDAIERDKFSSAYEHYVRHGNAEVRSGSPKIIESSSRIDSTEIARSLSPISPATLDLTLFPGESETRRITVSLPPMFVGDISSAIVPTVTSDELGLVQEIRPAEIQPGNVYAIDIALQGTGSTDSFNLQFTNLGETVFKIQAETAIAKRITANFVDAETDEKLRQGLSRTNGKVPDFPYGVLPTDLGLDLDHINERQIKLFSVPPTVISPPNPPDKPAKTWVIIHGWNDNPDDRSDTDPNPKKGNPGDFADLAGVLANANSNDTVLLLDWRQAAASGKLNEEDSDLNALFNLGNYTAAKWIRPAAEFTVKALQSFGIDATNAQTNLNLIGHSLGSLMSNEIARIYKEGLTEDEEPVISGNGVGVNAIMALDPPSQTNLSLFSAFIPGIGYDIDGRTPEADFVDPTQGIYIPKFREVSKFSRAFVGSRSLGGNQLFAEQAHESIQLDFGDRIDVGQEHGWVVQNFKRLVDETKQLGEIGKLFNPIPIAQLLTPAPNFAENAYANAIGGKHDASLAVKQPNSVLELPQPIALIFKNKSGENDDIVYGTPGDDILDSSNTSLAFFTGDSRFNAAGNDIFYGDFGNDRILSGSGNDTIEGSQGRDTINGEQDGDRISGGTDDDYIFGGKGDDAILGDEDNDTLEGNNGSDTLIGGAGNDRLEGNNEDDLLIGGIGRDTMSGGLGRDTFVFAVGDGSVTVSSADIIEDFRSGISIVFGNRNPIGDVRGVSQVRLTGGLTRDRIQTEKLGDDTILRTDSEVLAILKNVDVRRDELNFV